MIRGDEEPPMRLDCFMSVMLTTTLLCCREWTSCQRTGQSCCMQGTDNEVGNSETGLDKQGV